MRKKATSQRKIELSKEELLALIIDYNYGTIEYILTELRSLKGKRIDLCSDIVNEPKTVNDWMQDAVDICLRKVSMTYSEVAKNTRKRLKNEEL